MDHQLAYASIIYLASFRLAIIAVGGLSIWLGYRLFAKGLFPEQPNTGTALEIKTGDSHFSLKNAAPGTFFALFGVVLISMMLINAPAEVDYNKTHNAETQDVTKNNVSTNETWRFRGSEANPKLAKDFHVVAWQYHDAKDFTKAVAFARLAIHLEPNNAQLMDSLATMLLQVDQYAEALKYKEKAAVNDSKYLKGMQKFREKVFNEK